MWVNMNNFHIRIIIKERSSTSYLPAKSEGTFPLLNRPVGTPPWKSSPYGRKLQRAIVIKLLLLPVSMIESPNTKTAGMETFGGSFITPFVLQHETTNNNIVNLRSLVQVQIEEGRPFNMMLWLVVFLSLLSILRNNNNIELALTAKTKAKLESYLYSSHDQANYT